jgi:integrase
MLKCGLRRKEVAFACFSDIDTSTKTLLIQGKPEFRFRVKNYMQRYVPIPDDLFDELMRWKADHPGQTLIVPNGKGKPNLRLIRDLKRFAYLHGLRCGRCSHCRSGNPECEEWELHKFRRTYATGLVRNVDLRTAQGYLGHKRITSTERYLRAGSAADGQKKVSKIDWTKPFYV